jgi:hypothetical protein
MSDKLVFDLAQEIEGSPNVFVRKDWVNILDNQNQNYNNNQSVIDTSQLSNSNKYMSYREAYFSIPFILTLGITASEAQVQNLSTVTIGTTLKITDFSIQNDYALGLKNWFGQIIHSFTLDYNGVTCIQQTPYINMWNSFKLMTSLSMADVLTQGCQIGFYPDNANSFAVVPVVSTGVVTGSTVNNPTTGFSTSGNGTVNNMNNIFAPFLITNGNSFATTNEGMFKRQQNINFDFASATGGFTNPGAAVSTTATYGALINPPNFTNTWKSYISARSNSATVGVANPVTLSNAAGNGGFIQYAVVATVYLKHVHSFFNMCPLLKGVFMKMTMNLNNTSSTIVCNTTVPVAASSSTVGAAVPAAMFCTSVQNPQAGANPIMIASGASNSYTVGNQTATYPGGSRNLFVADNTGLIGTAPAGGGNFSINVQYSANISVGATCLNQVLASIYGSSGGVLSKSIYLYIPAYTFNPIFEQAYLSNPVKQIKYTDVYQYQVINVGFNQSFNNLLTNGIANIKSVLILPFYSANTGAAGVPIPIISGNVAGGVVNGSLLTTLISTNTGLANGQPVWQSPFDPAGTGCTSPLCAITNFNIQVSGQNAIYNVERYNFEQWNNQLYGQNAVNGGLTDGITSSLIGRQEFDMEYCYYYVNVERMLPVEETVPKSIQILGQNLSSRNLDLYCFIEYQNSINIDALTGARV